MPAAPASGWRFGRTMAGFYACLKTQDDPTMAESLSEVSGSLDVLKANDEVKKKSKFKVFKTFFGKKKKKEPEGAQGGRRLKPSLSRGNIDISSLKPVVEGQHAEARAKSSMGSKVLSHESIFRLDPEPEISVSGICPSPEPQRGRTRQLPSLHRRHSSSSPPLIQSDIISANFEEISVDEESHKILQKKVSPVKTMTSKKSNFEPSPGPTHSQSLSSYAMIASPGNSHQPMSLSSPATTCLDSAPSGYKMAFHPRKQKKKKNPQTTGEAKQEEPILLAASGEEKSTTKPKDADKKKLRKGSAGVSSLKQSKRTEMHDKKPADQAAWADSAGGQSQESAAQGRRRSKKGSSASGSSECLTRGSFKQSSQGLGPCERAGSPPADKTARDCLLWNLSLERQVTESPATPQELLSDRDGKGKRKAGVDFKARKAPVSQSVPEDQAESAVRGPSPCQEDGASGAEQPQARAAHSSGTESLSTTQEDVIFSVAMEAQVFRDPCHLQSEGEEAFSFDLQAIKFKMESVQDIPAACREKSPASILRAFTASISGPAGSLAEGGISTERLTPRNLSWVLRKPRAKEVSSDPGSPAEEESCSEQLLLPRHSFQPSRKLGPSRKPDDDQEVFTKSESSAAELSSPEQQLASRYPTGAYRNPKAEEASSDPESTAEEQSGSEQSLAPSHPFQLLGEPDDDQEVSDSEGSGDLSSSDEPLSPTSTAQTFEEPEDQVSTESNSYVEKYDSAEDCSSSEQDGPPTAPSQASGKPTDQQQKGSASNTFPEEWDVSVEQLALSFSRPILPQHVSSGSARPPAPESSPVEPAPPRQPVQPPWSPQAEQQASEGPGSWSAAARGGIAPEPLPPGISSKSLGRPRVEQPVSKRPEISTAVGVSSAEPPPPPPPPPRPLPPPPPPKRYSQPPREPVAKQAIRAHLEVPAVQGNICPQLPPPRRASQAVQRPVIEQQVRLRAESAGVDQNAPERSPPLPGHHAQPLPRPLRPRQASASLERPAATAEPWPAHGLAQASMNPSLEPNVLSGLEAAAAEVNSVEPPLPTYSTPSLTDPEAPQASESAVTDGLSAELPPRGPSQPAVRPRVPLQPAPPEPVGVSAAGCHRPGLGVALGPALVPGPASPRTVYRSWLSSSVNQQDSEREESAALEWGISLEPWPLLPPLPPRKPSQNPRRRAAERAVSQRSASAPPQRSTPSEQRSAPPEECCAPPERSTPPERHSVPSENRSAPAPPEQLGAPPEQSAAPPEQRSAPPEWTTPPERQSTLVEEWGTPPEQCSAPPEQQGALPEQLSVPPEQWGAPPEQWHAPTEQKLPRCAFRSRGRTKVKQPVSEALEGAEALRRISMEQRSLRKPSRTLTRALVSQPAFLAPEGSIAQRSCSTDQLFPRMPSQTLTTALIKQPIFLAPEGSIAQRSHSTDQLFPRMSSEALTTALIKQPIFLALEGFTVQRSCSTDQLFPRMPSQTLAIAGVNQPTFLAPEGSTVQRSRSIDQLFPRMPSQTLAIAGVNQPTFLAPEGSTVQRSRSIDQLFPRMPSQTLAIAGVNQPTFLAPESSMVQRSRSIDQLFPRMPSQTLAIAGVNQPTFLASEGFMAQRSHSTDQLFPRMPSQTLAIAGVKQPTFLAPESFMAQRSRSTDQLFPRMPSQTLAIAGVNQPTFLASEGFMAQRSRSTDQLSPRMPSQALTTAGVKQPIFLVPEGSMAQRSRSTDQLSPRMPSQAPATARVKQQASTALECIATDRDDSTQSWPSRQPSQSPGRYRVLQISSNFESVAALAAMSARPVSSKYPTQFSSRSKVQEMSSRLENIAAERSATKPPVSRHPSQWFVKYMAEQVFSEIPADPLSANQLSKSLLRSKIQYPVFLDPENASTEGGISSKLLPPARPSQPLESLEGPREVLPHLESAPTQLKQSSSKEQLPPRHLSLAPAKLEYQQVPSSASHSSPEIWKRSEEQLPSRGPPQAKEGAKLQPQLFSACLAIVPRDWSRSAERRPRHRRHPCQVLAELEYQPQVCPGSESATDEGTTSESHPSSRSLPRDPASSNKTRKQRLGSEDLIKNILPPATKPTKFTTAPTRQAFTSGGTYPKGEGLESGNRNNSNPNVSTIGAGVETIFGVRLRKVPSLKKYKSEKQEDLIKLSSLFLRPVSSSTDKEQQIRSFSLGTAENPTTASDLVEKQQSRPRSESITKKQPVYKVPGKALGRQTDYMASEPAWITMVKQRHRSSQAQIPRKEAKIKNKAGAKPEAKEHRLGEELAAAYRAFQKGAGLASENHSRKTFTSGVNKQEKMAQKKLPTSTKTEFEEQKIAQVPAMVSETKQPSTLPPVFHGPAELEVPIWFSLAKEKAKAWSHIAEIMQ